MSCSVTPWDDWYNAAIYDSFVEEFDLYDALNIRLAELADVENASRVLDLACGTGNTARHCLARLPADGELVGVDAAEAMVGTAQARIDDSRASFSVASATDLDHLEGHFDRVVSNAALGLYFTLENVLTGLEGRLAPDALFVFNVPAAQLSTEPQPVHPFQIAMVDALDSLPGGYCEPEPRWFDRAGMTSALEQADFSIEQEHRFTYHAPQSEFVELMSIPALSAGWAPDILPERRGEAIRHAASRVDLDMPVEVSWIYFVARHAA